MPYTDVKDGKIVGLDAEILQEAAANLGLKIEFNMTDFKGMLGGVQSHRVDLTIGGVGWSPDRAQKGLFTDPVYYSPPAMAVVGDKPYKTVDDLKGQKIGTVTGYVWEKSDQGDRRRADEGLPGRRHVLQRPRHRPHRCRLHRPAAGDLPGVAEPEHEVQAAVLQPADRRADRRQAGLQGLPPDPDRLLRAKQAPKLEKALDAQIDKMYKNGKLAAMVQKWGGDPNEFLKPAPYLASLRPGVDRPAGWTLPTI